MIRFATRPKPEMLNAIPKLEIIQNSHLKD